MRGQRRTLWGRFLCRMGWHREIGTTIASYIRCYGCGKDYNEQTGVWMDHTTFLESSFYAARCEQHGFER